LLRRASPSGASCSPSFSHLSSYLGHDDGADALHFEAVAALLARDEAAEGAEHAAAADDVGHHERAVVCGQRHRHLDQTSYSL